MTVPRPLVAAVRPTFSVTLACSIMMPTPAHRQPTAAPVAVRAPEGYTLKRNSTTSPSRIT